MGLDGRDGLDGLGWALMGLMGMMGIDNKKKVYELEFVKQVVCVAVDGAGCGAGVCLRL